MKVRRGAGTVAGVLAVVVLASPAAAQSPAPSSVPAADCGPVAAMLPHQVDGLALVSSIVPGVAAMDPEELFDPLLVSLGRVRADVCVVVVAYGSGTDVISGQLVHIRGAAAPDLAARFSDALRERLVAYGASATSTVADMAGQQVWSLDIDAGGQASQVLAAQLGDTLLVMSDPAAMARLLPLLALAAPPPPSSVPGSVPASEAPAPSG